MEAEKEKKNIIQLTNATSTDLSMWSLGPISVSEKLLSSSGQCSRTLELSSGSDLRVSNTLPGKLRPLSNLHSEKK